MLEFNSCTDDSFWRLDGSDASNDEFEDELWSLQFSSGHVVDHAGNTAVITLPVLLPVLVNLDGNTGNLSLRDLAVPAVFPRYSSFLVSFFTIRGRHPTSKPEIIIFVL